MSSEQPLSARLRQLKGRMLSSVEFVQDYVQLRFDGPTLSCFAHPVLFSADQRLDWEGRDYRNHLCGLIGQAVAEAGVTDAEIWLSFESNVRVVVPLDDDGFPGPEHFEFRDGVGGIWVD